MGFGRVVCPMLTAAGVAVTRVDLGGGDLEDHLHPGALVASSRRARIERAAGDEESIAGGSSKSVIENPGMFRLVCQFNSQSQEPFAETKMLP